MAIPEAEDSRYFGNTMNMKNSKQQLTVGGDLHSLLRRREKVGGLGALDYLIARHGDTQSASFPRQPLVQQNGPRTIRRADARGISVAEQLKLIRNSNHFHKKWYREQHPWLELLGLDAATHYLMYGAALGFSPGKHFDAAEFQRKFPQATYAGINPLVFLALYGESKPELDVPGVGEAKKLVASITTKLLSLGFTEKPLSDLRHIAERGAHAEARSLASQAIALWMMRQKDEAAYREALVWIDRALMDARALDQRSKLRVVQLLCHYHLGESEIAVAALQCAYESGEATPDVLLAKVNFAETAEERLNVVNEMLRMYRIPELALLPGSDAVAYDRLTAAAALTATTNGPLVTVIVAAYNSTSELETAIRSLQEQTWKNLEIIILDDSSPKPETLLTARSIAAADSRVRVIAMETNGGAYVARNRGLDLAAGEFVTLNDADDWSHPQKIETQVRFLIERPQIVGCTTQQARATTELRFTRWTGSGVFINTNTSSFMFRKAKVREEIGYWDNVRFSADNELIRRIKNRFGEKSVVHLAGGPYSFQRESGQSIVADEVLGINGFLFGARRNYFDLQSYHHRKSDSKKYSSPNPANRAFPAPQIMQSHRRAQGAVPQHFSLIVASDFRMKGGSTLSCIEELKATVRGGRSAAIFEMYRYDLFSPGIKTNMLDEVHELLRNDGVKLLSYGETATCDLLILRYPPILNYYQRYLPSVQAKNIKVIVNQPPMSDYGPNGVVRYDIKSCVETIQKSFGQSAVWHPIGPLVRDALVKYHAEDLDHIDLAPEDWSNIIDVEEWAPRRVHRQKHGKLRIGRHSRDAPHKWPETSQSILSAYPVSDEIEVHVLGGAKVPSDILGFTPHNWIVHEFGKLHPRDFLSEIDVWVYFANPDWVESFGRTIIEAMAVGVPVILPDIYRVLFGPAALYASPETAVSVARWISSDSSAYTKQVELARSFVRKAFSYESHLDRLLKLEK